MLKKSALLFCFVFCVLEAHGDDGAEVVQEEISGAAVEEKSDPFEFKSFMLLPAAAYTEETGFMLGGVFVKFLEGESHYDLLALVSFKNQWTLYNKYETSLDDGHLDFTAGTEIQDWKTRFYERGNEIDTGKYAIYTKRNFRAPLTLNSDYFLPKAWDGRFRYGVEFDAELISFKYDENFPAIEPNEEEKSFRFGYGYNLTYDSREKNDWTRKGAFVQFRNIFFNNAGIGSGQDNSSSKNRQFIWKNITTSMYFPVPFLPEGALALSSYLEDFDGDVPFDRLAQPDGAGQMRGLKRGLLADKTSWVLQSEIRSYLFWRFAGTIFYEAGKVGDGLHNLWENKWHSSVGIGGRMLINKDRKTHIRGDLSLIDFKYPGMTITLREAF